MSQLSFNQINQLMQQHFLAKTYAEGFVLANQALMSFPQQYPLINYWRICLSVQTGATDQANSILEETLSAGTWYSQTVLRENPALEAIQGDQEFERLAEISAQMQQHDPKEGIPMLVLRQQGNCSPGDETGCPLLLFLHGNQQTAHAHLKQWHPLSEAGWLVALPQSSNALWADAHVWMDHNSAAGEVEHDYKQLEQQYAINQDQIILAGFAMGAEMALALALSGRIKCHGFICLAPAGPLIGEVKQWQRYLEQAQGKTLRGVIIIGQEDDNILPDHVNQLHDMLNRDGIATELRTIPNIGHEYPPKFDKVLSQAIKYIIG